MKFVEVIAHLLPGAATWDEESLAEARACLEKAGPVFADLLDEDGADAAVPPTPAAPVEEAPPVTPTPAPDAPAEAPAENVVVSPPEAPAAPAA